MQVAHTSAGGPPEARNEERLRLLIETGLLLTSERSLDVVVQAALDAGLELCKAHYGVFYYRNMDEQGRAECLHKTAGRDGAAFAALFDAEEVAKLRFPKGAVFSADISTDEDGNRSADTGSHANFVEGTGFRWTAGSHPRVRSFIAIPVRSRDGETIGGMFYAHPEPAAFDPLSLDLVATVAAQAAIAIDNVRLSERLSLEFATVDAARRLQRQTADRLRQALDAAQLGTWTWDRKTDVLDLDERAAKLFRVEPHAPITRSELRERAVAPEDRAKTMEGLQRSLEDGSLYSVEYRIELPGGEETWVSSVGVVTCLPDSTEIVGMVGTIQNITARKTHDSSLLQSEKLAATGRLAATIAHEINNPLEAVTNLIYLSRTDPNIPIGVRRLLETADSELARVSQIAQQTLGFYRDTTRPIEIDLNQLLQSVADLFSRKMTSCKISCDLDLEENLSIHGLQGEIRQVFSNLVVNAIDALSHPAKSGRIRIRGRHLRGPRRGVSVLVCDEGPGIPHEVRERVFSPFFTTKPTVGTGLGLWVTRGFVEKQGGRIRFRSRTDARSGTIFRVILPCAAETAPTGLRR